ncbi:IclR family transcriptional regulator [Halomicrococcus sp. NG-SE-24]|uniref:IclR family transcriptional regulator n=1 Tax=Halomicrococcus sp. NG-SE-24 TaxID=3436928 RepID=UPI003D95CAF4
MSERSSKTVNATVNSFQILEKLVTADREMGVTELAESVDLSKGVVHKHLYTLSELGYVKKQNQRYAPSFGILEPGDKTRRQYPIYSAARPHVDNLARSTDEASMLFIEEEGAGIPIYIATGAGSWSPEYCCGERLPLHTLAPGKAILASMNPHRANDIISERSEKPTEQSITDPDRLRDELSTIRENGVAFSREEQSTETVGVAASVSLNERGPAAAIAVSGPADRLSGRYLEEDITGQVISTAKSIQVDLSKSTN